ncbi:MAG: rane protein exporter [Myxococcaceae bacterium]|nr:rane protein exporter [Myxococcaceae bacterium]
MRLLVFFALALACTAYLLFGLEVRTPITEFLPRDESTGLLELARGLSEAPQARVLVLTLSAARDQSHHQAAHDLAERLRKSDAFEWVRDGVSSDDEQQFYRLLFPARVGLVPLPPGSGPVPDAYLAERVAALRERLAGPLGMLERRLAPDDPLGGFVSVLEAQTRSRGQLRVEDHQLVTQDGRWSVVFAATRASAFDAEKQLAVQAAIDSAFADGRRKDASLKLEWSGLNRFALAGERSVRGDIERISTLSVLGIFLLYLGVFRSFREPLLVLLPIAFGCLLATAACQLAFGFVHGLALAFGSSIIGVAEDYSTHFFAHRLAAPESEDNEQLMRRLWPGMWLGAATTIAGIATLFGSGFRGLQQMAMFGAVGVLAALLCTRYVLPQLSRKKPRLTRTRFTHWGERMVERVAERRWLALWFVAPALLPIALGLPGLHFDDSLSALRTKAPALDAENQRVQARLGRGTQGRVVVALGTSDEAALASSERVLERLSKAEQSGQLRSLRSVSTLLPSVATQRARRERMQGDPTFLPRLHAALEQQGFVASAFAPFDGALRQAAVTLTPESLLHTPLAAAWLAPFRAELKGKVAYLTSLEASREVDVAGLLAGLPDVYFVDQEGLFSAAYASFRTRILSMVLLGLGLVLLTLFLRYRSARVSLLGMVPAVLGAGAALGVEALRGVPATLMHVIGVLLVLSMGVDYGIYALESRSSVEEGVTTLGSVLLAALTTVLSFGLLGVSSNPALAAIGSTVGFGLFFTVLASPVVLALTRQEKT